MQIRGGGRGDGLTERGEGVEGQCVCVCENGAGQERLLALACALGTKRTRST